MIIYNEIDKEITFPKGIGNTPEGYECPVLNEICITENGEFDGYFDKVIVNVPDLNGSYDDGYSQGYSDGNDNGYNVGKAEQKSKLTPITITENGTYNREDGYSKVTVAVPDLNGSYDDGYNDGFTNGKIEGTAEGKQEQKSLMVRTNITRNAVYSREDGYNEVEVNVQPETMDLEVSEVGYYSIDVNEKTGYDIYSYARTSDWIEFRLEDERTDITDRIEVEFWARIDETIDGNCEIFSIQNKNLYLNYNSQKVYITNGSADRIGETEIKLNKWIHYIISSTRGFIIDDVKITDFTFNERLGWAGFKRNTFYNSTQFLDIGEFIVNDISFVPSKYGYIEKESGFLTRNLLQNVELNYFYHNMNPLEKAVGSLTVKNQKIDVAREKIKFSRSTFRELPSYLDFSNCTDMSNMFENTPNLQTLPLIDTSNVTNMSAIFQGSGIKNLPLINTSNVTNMNYMFTSCTGLKTIPLINTSKVTSMTRMFSASGFEIIPQIDTSNVESADRMFYNCSSLYSIPPLNAEKMNLKSYGIFGGTLGSLTDFGGLIGLKSSSNNNYSFNSCPNLSYESCMNILNGLYDFTGNGETPNSNQGQLKVHANFLTTVGDEISIGTLKGWSISV